MSKLKLAFILMMCAMPLVGCDTNEGPAERMGERVDEAADETAESFEDAGERMKEGAEDTCEKLSKEDC